MNGVQNIGLTTTIFTHKTIDSFFEFEFRLLVIFKIK